MCDGDFSALCEDMDSLENEIINVDEIDFSNEETWYVFLRHIFCL